MEKINDNLTPACDCSVIHEDVVREVGKSMPDDEVMFNLAEFFKIFGDSTRVRIICALFRSEMCVCDIAALLGMTKSAISHQLRILKQSKLVKNRRNGKVVYYSLDDEHIAKIIDQGLAHILE
ncbi:MAG TPA: metalloregulator ArsR/SmtB family transcription factor [Clostridiales bacterium]|nr:metalloregulator ArsR/SmtB family transcription factor [Clostridiales bacterium]